MTSKIILGIETSCDETAAAVVQKHGDRIQILSNVVASSAAIQAKYGGVIPEQAAREQIKSIIPVIEEALAQAFPEHPASDFRHLISELNAIAVTQGPGLIGSLLVGVETAKTLALVWEKPLIPVNHLMGHFYANWIVTSSLRGPARSADGSLNDSHHEVVKQSKKKVATSVASLLPRNDVFGVPIFPCIGLLVSGGHTDLILMKSHQNYTYLGGTRDDAAGECFDKCARLMGLRYPGGPEISRLASKGDAFRFKLPRPMIDTDDYDFSFSGLKTAVSNLYDQIKSDKPETREPVNLIYRNTDTLISSDLSDLCASIEQAIVDVLVKKTVMAAKKYCVEQIIIAGGVAANKKLAKNLGSELRNLKSDIRVLVPPPELCTDNAAMIAARAFFEKPVKNPLAIQADPSLNLNY